MSTTKKLPIEIINKILIYIGELNDEVIITQYNGLNCFYKINFYSDFLWDLKGLLLMKCFYPILSTHITASSELYKLGKQHYKSKLKQKTKFIF